MTKRKHTTKRTSGSFEKAVKKILAFPVPPRKAKKPKGQNEEDKDGMKAEIT